MFASAAGGGQDSVVAVGADERATAAAAAKGREERSQHSSPSHTMHEEIPNESLRLSLAPAECRRSSQHAGGAERLRDSARDDESCSEKRRVEGHADTSIATRRVQQ